MRGSNAILVKSSVFIVLLFLRMNTISFLNFLLITEDLHRRAVFSDSIPGSSNNDVRIDGSRILHVYYDSESDVGDVSKCYGCVCNSDIHSEATFEFNGRVFSKHTALQNNTLFITFHNKVKRLSKIIVQKRAKSWYPFHGIGVLVRGNEENEESAAFMGAFDYVIMNYYFEKLNQAPYVHVRALGNLSCGLSDHFPPVRKEIESSHVWKGPLRALLHREPRLGTFWKHTGGLHTPLEPSSFILASERKFAFCFVGSLRKDRNEMTESFFQIFTVESEYDERILTDPISGLTVFIGIEAFFGGTLGEFEYNHHVLSNCAISVNPIGVNAETIRFADALSTGTIPLMIANQTEYFRSKFFSPPSVLLIDAWNVESIRNIIQVHQNALELNSLQKRGLAWRTKLLECQRQDFLYLISS